MSKHQEYVKVVFTDAEVADFARGLAQANRKRSSIEQQKKEVDTQLKAEIEAENTNIKRLSDHISNGHEYRNVECRVDLDVPEDGKKSIIRLDTGEVVKVLPMTDMDRQMRLELRTAEEAAAIAANPSAVVEAAPGAEIPATDPPTPEVIPEPPAAGPVLASAREVGATHRRGARNRNPEAEGAIQRRGNRDPNAEAIADGTAPLEGEDPDKKSDDAPF